MISYFIKTIRRFPNKGLNFVFIYTMHIFLFDSFFAVQVMTIYTIFFNISRLIFLSRLGYDQWQVPFSTRPEAIFAAHFAS